MEAEAEGVVVVVVVLMEDGAAAEAAGSVVAVVGEVVAVGRGDSVVAGVEAEADVDAQRVDIGLRMENVGFEAGLGGKLLLQACLELVELYRGCSSRGVNAGAALLGLRTRQES